MCMIQAKILIGRNLLETFSIFINGLGTVLNLNLKATTAASNIVFTCAFIFIVSLVLLECN